GRVFEALDPNLDRKVALKTIAGSPYVDDTTVERFKTEAKILALLNHPHIVTIYSTGTAGGAHYIAMEYVDGENLDQRLARGGLSMAEALPWFHDLLDAVEAAHASG